MVLQIQDSNIAKSCKFVQSSLQLRSKTLLCDNILWVLHCLMRRRKMTTNCCTVVSGQFFIDVPMAFWFEVGSGLVCNVFPHPNFPAMTCVYIVSGILLWGLAKFSFILMGWVEFLSNCWEIANFLLVKWSCYNNNIVWWWQCWFKSKRPLWQSDGRYGGC